jgi:glycine dehydrogenase
MTTISSSGSGQAHVNGSTSHAGGAVGERPSVAALLSASDTFAHRHIGPDLADTQQMLAELGYPSLEAFTDAAVPESIRLRQALKLDTLHAPGEPAPGESAIVARLHAAAKKNVVAKSYIGAGYYDTITPAVILRNVLENPGWYTQYTPYQAEIAQGRLEALLNFQTMVSDLTGLPLAGASLLDEATAAAEAMAMTFSIAGGHDGPRHTFLIAKSAHPQTISVVKTRGESMGVNIIEIDPARLDPAIDLATVCGVLVQYPDTTGRIDCFEALTAHMHASGVLVVAATDLLALTLIKPPGEWGADVCIGSAQRFGVPMGGGGPHAAFIATKSEYARKLPGRIIGVSKDAQGNVALRMAIQTREQHIKRDKATSNICTAQALLAIIAGLYAAYHGPEGLRRIALRVHTFTQTLRRGLRELGHAIDDKALVFDTLHIKPSKPAAEIVKAAAARNINLRTFADGTLGISLDETTTRADVQDLLSLFGGTGKENIDELASKVSTAMPPAFARQSGYLTHPVFTSNHSEHEMLRYIFTLMGRDLSLTHSMIALGSCTMKLNATSEMIPVTWPEFGRIHPFAPREQLAGYHSMFVELERWLAEITGFAATSLQPNAGSQGEYAGLLVIRAYHHARGDTHRDICLIPDSAHGTNPASAVIAGMRVVPIKNMPNGDIDLADLTAKAELHKDKLAALMVTYPSTYGVFEEHIKDICAIVHDRGGQVYMDGANMNAQVGLCRPGDIGADVCHLNLHKTFCIPHGGGGPGMGPICVAKHLAPFLAGHDVSDPWALNPVPGVTRQGAEFGVGTKATGAVSAAPFGSPSILAISWMYIAMMGADGLRRATEVAILNANYMARRLSPHFKVLFTGKQGLCAHEFIIDIGHFDQTAGVKAEDVAKRLMDYGFHAPTMSWPVAGTLMIEPTESEPKAELDRFCDAMIAIRQEIAKIERGEWPRDNNPLKHAPHTASVVSADDWTRPYSRTTAAFPLPWLRAHKFWPSVGRIDNAFGDRNLVCACPPMSVYQ